MIFYHNHFLSSIGNLAFSSGKARFFIMANGKKEEKARYWVGILYPENMVDNWQNEIDDLVQVPYAYCVHHGEKDGKGYERKRHVHLILAFSNTTTYSHALSVFNSLSADGKKAINTCQRVINIRNKYDYLIHDTTGARKKKKRLYSPSDRITGNNFDIGAFETLSVADKDKMCRELANAILDQGIINFADFYAFTIAEFDDSYFEIVKLYSGFFERLIRGVYLKKVESDRRLRIPKQQ